MAVKFDPLLGQVRYDYWGKQSGGIRYTKGHVAVGTDADVDGIGPVNSTIQDIFGGGTYKSVIAVQETMTGTANVYHNGFTNKPVLNTSTSPLTFVGIENTATVASGSTATPLLIAGMLNNAMHRGSGTVTYAYGSPGVVNNKSTGSIGTAYGVYASITNESTGTITNAATNYIATVTNTGGGTVTTAYGIYLENQASGTTSFNIYSAGLASRNYFGGYVETGPAGGFYLGTSGSINNRFLLNTPVASDSTAEQINTPSSTARKALVLQMNSGQTGSALEIQDNSGTPLTYANPGGSIYFSGTRTFTALDYNIRTNGTYTVDFANAIYPVGYDYNATVIFKQNGFGSGSGLLFWNRAKVQNDSGTTRTVGPISSFASQPNIQANGGTLSPSYIIGYVSNAIIDRINSGASNVTNNIGAWVQGATVGTGCTLTNDIGFYYGQAGSNSGTWTNSAGVVIDAMTLGTNKTSLLIGTATVPSGSYTVYSTNTNPEFFSGDVQFVKETARTIGIQDTTTAATAGATLTILGAKGSNTTSGTGGAINVTAGDGRQGNSAGGAVSVTAGAGVGLSTGGAINITAGGGLTGGTVTINGGNGVADGNVRIASTDGLVAVGHANTPGAHLDVRSRVASTDALSVDNVAVAANIAIFKDNGTAVWTIADGGNLTAGEGINVVLGTSTGTKIGTATTQKLAFYNSTPVTQPSGTGETVGFTAGSGTGVNDDSTFTGNVGSTAYRISDIVKALKNLGILAA